MNLHIETEQESDGCWIAEVPEIPCAMSYGPTHVEAVPEMSNVFSVAA